jgi:hypothetical protein
MRMGLLDRLLRRPKSEPHVGPQGEEYEILKMQQQRANEGEAFAENMIKNAGHRGSPFLDDPVE